MFRVISFIGKKGKRKGERDKKKKVGHTFKTGRRSAFLVHLIFEVTTSRQSAVA